MFRKIAVVLSIFFIFDRFIHYKLDQNISSVTAAVKETIIAQPHLFKGYQARQRLVAQESKRRSTSRT